MNIEINKNLSISFTAHELLERKEEFMRCLKRELEGKLNKERNLALPILRQLIAEFNRKAENEYEENYVDLDQTPIPTSLKTEKVIEFIEDEFQKKGFLVKSVMKAGRTYVRVSWEYQGENENEETTTLDSMIRRIVDEKIKEALSNLKK